MRRKDAGSLELGAPPWIIGHRGAAGSALENSLAAIRAAVEQGADMVEVDIQLTADEVPVLFHDWDLRRLAGRGEIVERSSAELLGDIRLPDPFGGEPLEIPSLQEALAVLPPDLPVNLELKRRFHSPRGFAKALTPLLDLHRPTLVSSFDWNLLAEIRRLLPDLPLAPLGRWKGEELLATAELLDAFSVHAHRELAPNLLGSPLLSSRPLCVYTLNEALDARRLFERGAAAVFTDTPGKLKSDLGIG